MRRAGRARSIQSHRHFTASPRPSRSPAISIIDRFWSKLSDGGQRGQCGWLKDRYGLSWQIVPSALPQMIASARGAELDRIIGAVMTMTKFDVAALDRARAG